MWVGGAAHWSTIHRHLSRPGDGWAEAVPRDRQPQFELGILDPQTALSRYLDDIPRVTWEFHLATEEDPAAVESFDKWRAIASIIQEATGQFRAAYGAASAREMGHYELLLRKMLLTQGRLTPRLTTMWQAARAAVGPRFATLLVEKALAYPFPGMEKLARGETGYPVMQHAGDGWLRARSGGPRIALLNGSPRLSDRRCPGR